MSTPIADLVAAVERGGVATVALSASGVSSEPRRVELCDDREAGAAPPP
jgi:hypothetical protein